jgi:trk system potassium uptake protein TrkH
LNANGFVMFDIRPIGYVIGIIVAFLGVMMIFPMILDFADGNPHWRVFAQAGAITMISGLVCFDVLFEWKIPRT